VKIASKEVEQDFIAFVHVAHLDFSDDGCPLLAEISRSL
jgi:hypothetical protein